MQSSHSLPELSLKYVLIPQSVVQFFAGNAVTNAYFLSVLNLEELSVSMLWFLSVSRMRRRFLSFSVCEFSGKDEWKKLDIDVRPTFHPVAGYPLSKHRTQLTNESHRQAQRSKAFLKE